MLIALIIITIIGMCYNIVNLICSIKDLKTINKQLEELQISFAKHEQEHSERSIRINRKLNDLEADLQEKIK